MLLIFGRYCGMSRLDSMRWTRQVLLRNIRIRWLHRVIEGLGKQLLLLLRVVTLAVESLVSLNPSDFTKSVQHLAPPPILLHSV